MKTVKLNWTRMGSRSGQVAYTLAEVVVAVLFIALMIISFYAGLSAGFAVVQLARENLRATQIMLQRMETVRLYRWDQLQDPKYFKLQFTERYDPLGVSSNAAGAVYSGVMTLSVPPDVPAAYQTNMRLLSLNLYWTNTTRSQKIVRARQMQTHVARYGMQKYIYGSYIYGSP